MDESYAPMDELDALIEAALSDEPFLKAPLSLHRNIEARVRLVALREHEHRRFAISMFTLVFLFFGSLACAGMLLWFTNLSFIYSEGVSGGKGWFDYYTHALSASFSSYQGAYSMVMSFVLALITIFLTGIWQVHKFIYSD